MNVCIFSGRLTKDAETRYTQSGKCVCSFGLAVDTGFGDNKKTVFLNCSVWNKEALAQYLTKGKPVIVHGEYTERSRAQRRTRASPSTWCGGASRRPSARPDFGSHRRRRR